MSQNTNLAEFPKMLDDHPTSTDRFGAHQRLARAIHSVICRNSGGKTISIEGEWGSGKSSVIKLLEQEVAKVNDITLITYDAWAHSGDPLRRAFLNTIIDVLSQKMDLSKNESWLHEPTSDFINKHQILQGKPKLPESYKDKNFWRLVKNRLSGKFKESEKSVTPTLTKEGEVLVYLIFLFPLASLFVVNMLKGYLFDAYFFLEWPALVNILFWFSVALIIAPFLYIGIIKAKSENENHNLLFLIFNKTTIEETSSTIEAPEPTTIEFQEVFSSVMDMALEQEARRLVIVIDNLDRLEDDEAENVWVLLRSFIDQNSFDKRIHKWAQKIWVIVPIATNKKEIKGLSEEGDNSTQPKDFRKGNEQFLDKVFQIRFKIPPPVLTNWQNYLFEILDEAFGYVSSEDKKKIHWLYDHYQNSDILKRPTPRSLILFVNELVGLKTLWNDKFSITTLSAFCLDTKGQNVLADLQSNKIPNNAAINLLGEELKSDYASMFFNIDNKSKAQELLYIPLIENSLIAGHDRTLSNLANSNKDFEQYLMLVIRQSLSKWLIINPAAFFNALIIIDSISNGLTDTSQKILDEDSIKLIYENAKKSLEAINGLPILIPNFVGGCRAFINMSKTDQPALVLMNALDRFHKLTGANNSYYPDAKSTYLDWIDKIEELINIEEFAEAVIACDDFSIQLPIDLEDWNGFCYDYLNDRFDIWKKFKPELSHNEISEGLVASIDGDFLDEYEIATLNWIAKINALDKYKKVLGVLEQSVISKNQNESSLELINIFYLQNFKDQILIRNSSKKILNSGGYYNQFNHSIKNLYIDSAASTLLLVLVSDFTVPDTDMVLNSELGKKSILDILSSVRPAEGLPTKLLDLISLYHFERLFIDIAVNKPIFKDYFTRLFLANDKSSDIYDQFNLDKIGVEFESFILCFTTEVTRDTWCRHIAKHLIQNRSLIEVLLKNNLQRSDGYLCVSILLADINVPNELFSLIQKLLKSFKLNDWSEYLKTNTQFGRLLRLLKVKGLNVGLGQPLYNAIFKIMSTDMTGAESSYALKGALFAQSKIYKRKLDIDILTVVESAKSKFHKVFWDSFGELFYRSILSATGKSKIVPILSNLVSVSDHYGINFILSNIGQSKELINPYKTSVSDLRKKITSKLKITSSSDERRALNKLKLYIRRPLLSKKSQ